mgnify:CR=1 FL=1
MLGNPMNIPPISIAAAKAALIEQYADATLRRRATMLWGTRGVGKSSVVRQVAEHFKVPLVDLRLTTIEPVDLRGAIFADDTPVSMLAPGTGKTQTARLWTYARDERPWDGDAPPAAWYRFSGDRKGQHPKDHLARFRGWMHADGYAGFERFYQPTRPGADPPLIEVACWSHARRNIYEVHQETASPIAREALERIAALFVIEDGIRGLPPERRAALRAEHAAPRLEQLKVFLDTSLGRIKAAAEGA